MTPSSARRTPPSARSCKENGYATSWFGKDHNTPGFSVQHPPGPSINGLSAWASNISMASWVAKPTSGRPIFSATHCSVLHGSASPATTSPPTWPMTPSSTCVNLNAAAPDKPFFLYYVPGGSHSPHQPTQEWIDKFNGKFDMGWEKLREQIFENQKRLGVIPPNTKLTPWPDGQAEYAGAKLPRWDSLTDVRKEDVCARGGGLCRLHRLHRL